MPPPPSHTLWQVHAVGVCDTPDEFYEVVRHKAAAMGLQSTSTSTTDNIDNNKDRGSSDCKPPLYDDVRSWLRLYDGQGGGYGISSPEELSFLHEVHTA